MEIRGISVALGEIGAKASQSSSFSASIWERVGGVVDGYRLCPDAFGLELCLQLFECLWLTGANEGGGAVDRSKGYALPEGLRVCGKLFCFE